MDTIKAEDWRPRIVMRPQGGEDVPPDKMEVTSKDLLLFLLWTFTLTLKEKGGDEYKSDIAEVVRIGRKIETSIEVLGITEKDKDNPYGGLQYTCQPGTDIEELDRDLSSRYVRLALEIITDKEALKDLVKQAKDYKEGNHKQPVTSLKTTSRLIGRVRDTPNIWTTLQDEGEGLLKTSRDKITAKTAVLMLIVNRYFQSAPVYAEEPEGGVDIFRSKKNDTLVIRNLAPLARELGVENNDLKIHLVMMGGFQYPVDYKDDKGSLFLSTENMYNVTFVYPPEIGNQYGVKRYGTNRTSFIFNQSHKEVRIRLGNRISDDLKEKKDLDKERQKTYMGSVYVDNKYIRLINEELSDLGIKLMNYITSNQTGHYNRPMKIGVTKIIPHLGLAKIVEKQGLPYVKKKILEELEVLKAKGALKTYGYDRGKDILSWTCTNKYVKRPDKRPKEDPEG